MSNVSGIGLFSSDATASILSSKEQQYFKRVFGAASPGGESTAVARPTETASPQPHIGTKLNVKV